MTSPYLSLEAQRDRIKHQIVLAESGDDFAATNGKLHFLRNELDKIEARIKATAVDTQVSRELAQLHEAQKS